VASSQQNRASHKKQTAGDVEVEVKMEENKENKIAENEV
jgi:hypothetical protein